MAYWHSSTQGGLLVLKGKIGIIALRRALVVRVLVSKQIDHIISKISVSLLNQLNDPTEQPSPYSLDYNKVPYSCQPAWLLIV